MENATQIQTADITAQPSSLLDKELKSGRLPGSLSLDTHFLDMLMHSFAAPPDAKTSAEPALNRQSETSVPENPVVEERPGSDNKQEIKAEPRQDQQQDSARETSPEPKESDKSSQTEKPQRTDKPALTGKPAQTDRPTQTDKPAQTDRPTKTDKPAQTDKPEAKPARSTSEQNLIKQAEKSEVRRQNSVNPETIKTDRKSAAARPATSTQESKSPHRAHAGVRQILDGISKRAATSVEQERVQPRDAKVRLAPPPSLDSSTLQREFESNATRPPTNFQQRAAQAVMQAVETRPTQNARQPVESQASSQSAQNTSLPKQAQIVDTKFGINSESGFSANHNSSQNQPQAQSSGNSFRPSWTPQANNNPNDAAKDFGSAAQRTEGKSEGPTIAQILNQTSSRAAGVRFSQTFHTSSGSAQTSSPAPTAPTVTPAAMSIQPRANGVSRPAAKVPLPQVPLPPQQVINQVVKAARISIAQGREEMKLTLKPEELGWLKVKIAVDGQKVTARITVEREGVREILESNVKQLWQALQNQNLRISQIAIELHNDGSRQARESRDEGSRRSQGDARRETVNLEAETEMIPLIESEVGGHGIIDLRV